MIIGTFGLANMRSSAEGGSITFKPMRKEAPFQVAGPYRLGPRRSRGYLAQADKALPHKGKTRSMKILWIRNPQSKDYRGMALLGVDECDGPADSSFGAQATCKPGSVPGPKGPGDGHSSGTRVAAGLARPTRTTSLETGPCRTAEAAAAPSPLLGLAPGGVYRAADVAAGAVRSCRTLSPLPAGRARRPAPAGGLLSVALSLGSPPPGVTRHRVSVEPGLSSPVETGAAIRPPAPSVR